MDILAIKNNKLAVIVPGILLLVILVVALCLLFRSDAEAKYSWTVAASVVALIVMDLVVWLRLKKKDEYFDYTHHEKHALVSRQLRDVLERRPQLAQLLYESQFEGNSHDSDTDVARYGNKLGDDVVRVLYGWYHVENILNGRCDLRYEVAALARAYRIKPDGMFSKFHEVNALWAALESGVVSRCEWFGYEVNLKNIGQCVRRYCELWRVMHVIAVEDNR